MIKLDSFPLAKVLLVIFLVGLLLLMVAYFNNHWQRLRDFRREEDAKTIIRALQFYYNFFDEFPATVDDDSDGWDKSNDLEERSFLEPLVAKGILVASPFDPKNDEQYYYRYQKFPAGTFGCQRPFSIFQVMVFETADQAVGEGSCNELDFAKLAPYGFTWQDFE